MTNMLAGRGLKRPHHFSPDIAEGYRSKVALIHDWLTGMRGGERCLEALCALFQEADIYTLIHHKGKISEGIESRTIVTSFLQAIPTLRNHYRYLLPFFPLAIESFDLKEYPLIISCSHCVAKGVIPRPEAVHICYCLSPMRYIWDMYSLYFRTTAYRGLPKRVAHIVSHYLRLWDVASCQRVDRFAAISRFVASRIWRYYRRRSVVIYPPVECSRFSISKTRREDYYLLVSAEAPYKRVDLAMEAFRKLRRPLWIVGNISSEDYRRYQLLKEKNILLLGWVSDEEMAGLYANCRALIFPGVEDFGLVPVEAQATGRPVIAYGRGGVLESVKGIWTCKIKGMTRQEWKAGYSGLFYDMPNASSLVEAVEAFESVKDRFEPEEIRKWAYRFDRSVFEKRLLGFVEKTVREKSLDNTKNTLTLD